jgi:hypothetical protein
MHSEEIRRQERSQEIIAAQMSAQRRVLFQKVKDFNSAHERVTSVNAHFSAIKDRIRFGRVPLALVPVAQQELSRLDADAVSAANAQRSTRAAVDLEHSKLARLEAIYSQLGGEISKLQKAVESSELDELIDERVAQGLSGGDGDAAPRSSAVDLEPRLLIPRGSVPGNGNDRGVDSRRDQNQQSSRNQPNKTTVKQLKSALSSNEIQIKSADVWRQLERCGMNLELRLSTGASVSLALTKIAKDTVSVALSPSTLGSARSVASLKAEIAAALSREHLRIGEFRLLDAAEERT